MVLESGCAQRTLTHPCFSHGARGRSRIGSVASRTQRSPMPDICSRSDDEVESMSSRWSPRPNSALGVPWRHARRHGKKKAHKRKARALHQIRGNPSLERPSEVEEEPLRGNPGKVTLRDLAEPGNRGVSDRAKALRESHHKLERRPSRIPLELALVDEKLAGWSDQRQIKTLSGGWRSVDDGAARRMEADQESARPAVAGRQIKTLSGGWRSVDDGDQESARPTVTGRVGSAATALSTPAGRSAAEVAEDRNLILPTLPENRNLRARGPIRGPEPVKRGSPVKARYAGSMKRPAPRATKPKSNTRSSSMSPNRVLGSLAGVQQKSSYDIKHA